MDSETKTTPPKPLSSLGRDEMNLIEFPITLLTDRVPKDQTEAVYQDEIFDERTGRTLTRKLTVKAGGFGLTTAVDDEVLLALIQLAKQKNTFSNKKVEFTRLELIKMLGWTYASSSYDRIEVSLDRWTSVYLKYENAWRDNRTKRWTSPEGFHIIDNYKLNDSRTSGDQFNLLQSYIVWNQVIFDSFQAGYLKPLDYDLCMSLKSSTAKRMYRFLDKRFHHKPDWTFDLKELAHEHLALSRGYEGPAHLKRNLQPAITELETIGFLEPLPAAERFQKDGKDWKIRLIRQSPTLAAPQHPTLPQAEPEPPLIAALVQCGVTKATAVDLVQRHQAEAIEAKLEVFSWLTETQDKRIAKSPAGYLVKSIEKDYATPKGFTPKAERQQHEEARTARERQAADERRRQKQEEARERAERKAVAAYWDSLSPQQQAELDAAALAQADPATLADETGVFKRLGQTIRRDAYIRQLLKNREPAPAEG